MAKLNAAAVAYVTVSATDSGTPVDGSSNPTAVSNRVLPPPHGFDGYTLYANLTTSGGTPAFTIIPWTWNEYDQTWYQDADSTHQFTGAANGSSYKDIPCDGKPVYFQVSVLTGTTAKLVITRSAYKALRDV